MTEEEKSLLIKDLCARLPYGVQVQDTRCGISGKLHDMLVFPLYKGNNVYDYIATTNFYTDCHYDDIVLFKPYLFPLSSITEEQRSEISKLLIDTQNTFSPYGKINAKGCDNLFICTVKQVNVLINYCLTHHLDINGLIEKDLAIDAAGLNIY